MLVNIHRHVEGLLDVFDRRIGFDDHSVGSDAGNGHAILVCEADHGIVIATTRAKYVRELFYTEILLIVRAAWLVEILKECFQVSLIANRQADYDVKGLVCIESLYKCCLTLHGYVSCVSRGQGAKLAISRLDSTHRNN